MSTEQSNYPLVSEEYARAYEAGALAALDWLNDNYPDLEQPFEDCPSPTMAAAEHIGGVLDLLLGRKESSS